MNARIAPLFLALALTGCPEAVPVCENGRVRDPLGDCVPEPIDSGTPQPDAGPDAGDEADGGTDAGVVCATPCTAPQFCADLGGGDTGCVECTDASHCGGMPCVNNICLECDEHSDCTEDETKPICDGGSCRSCISAGDECSDRNMDTPACASSGACVQCTGENESACTDGVCHVLDQTCTTIAAGSATLCETCVNDAQCEPGQLCVPQRFGAPPALVSYVCAWATGAVGVGAPNGDCFAVAPYRASRNVTSLGGRGADPVTGEVCLLQTSTCEAHRDFLSRACTSETSPPSEDPACGAEDHADGFCGAASAGTNRCTVECSVLEDCPCSGGTCTSRYACPAGFCSLSRTCLVANPTTCTP